MPKKTHLKTQDFIQTGLALVAESGWANLSITAVAKSLGCSTMPVYSNFKNLETLKDEIIKQGWEQVKAYESNTYTGDIWVDQAIGYIFFARDSRKLFSCMLDGRDLTLERRMLQEHYDFLTAGLSGYQGFEGLSREECRMVRYSRAIFTQGMATTVSKGIGKLGTDDDSIKRYMTISSRAILEGFKKVYSQGDLDIRILDEQFQL